MRTRIFVGSSGEGVRICRAIQRELDDDYDVTVWDQDVFGLTYSAMDGLLKALDSSDAGIFVLRPDDMTTRRGTSEPSVRDNVLLELGMFIGRLGRGRAFMVAPSDLPVRLPSDLLGLTTANYDSARSESEPRPAVGAACTAIREQLDRQQLQPVTEPEFRERLDRAMARMSRDLEWLLEGSAVRAADPSGAPDAVSVRLGRATVDIEVGQIQDYQSDDPRTVVALPANEYFDDECVKDLASSLGAYAQHTYGAELTAFVHRIRRKLDGLPSQRVPRAERRIDKSYGIGQTVFLADPGRTKVILVSATTERVGIGLRAEPHFLYAALQGIIASMNANRLNSLTMPVLGSGHGGMPLGVALLFNLLALRSLLNEDGGRHIRHVRIVVFKGAASELSGGLLDDILSRVVPGA